MLGRKIDQAYEEGEKGEKENQGLSKGPTKWREAEGK